MSSQDKNVLKLLIESYYQGGGTFGRPDSSGIRGKGVGRKSYQSGGDVFPYDGDLGQTRYGEPQSYSRDNAGHGPMHQNVHTPKDIDAEDDRWEQDDLDETLDATPPGGNIIQDPGRVGPKFGVDDDLEEALGVPYSPGGGNRGTGGSHTGGRVTPGTSGQWGGRPKGGHWDNEIDDEELDYFGEYNYGLPFSGDITRRGMTTSKGDAELEDSLPPPPKPEEEEDFDALSFILKTAGSKFAMTPGHSIKHSRMQPGMTWKESRKKAVESYIRKLRRNSKR